MLNLALTNTCKKWILVLLIFITKLKRLYVSYLFDYIILVKCWQKQAIIKSLYLNWTWEVSGVSNVVTSSFAITCSITFSFGEMNKFLSFFGRFFAFDTVGDFFFVVANGRQTFKARQMVVVLADQNYVIVREINNIVAITAIRFFQLHLLFWSQFCYDIHH